MRLSLNRGRCAGLNIKSLKLARSYRCTRLSV